MSAAESRPFFLAPQSVNMLMPSDACNEVIDGLGNGLCCIWCQVITWSNVDFRQLDP